MNGSSSSTKGSDVASIGYWPKTLIEKMSTALTGISATLKKVLSGELSTAAVDFSDKSGSDCLSDAVMEEVARRLIVTLESDKQSNVIFSPTPPEDHLRAWWQTDQVTGIPIGQLKTWNDTQGQWVAVSQIESYSPPARRRILGHVAGGNPAQSVTFNFEDIKTEDYYVLLTPTTQAVDLTWNAAPLSFPSAYGWVVTQKNATSLVVSFFGVPTGGLMMDGFVEEIV